MLKLSRPAALTAALLCLLFVNAPGARAQERDAPKFEVGAHFTALELNPPGFGGVVEFYPTRRVVTRFDLGDTVVWYGERDAPGATLGQQIVRLPAETRHNFQFSAGLGLRF